MAASEAFPKSLVEGSGHRGSKPTNWKPLPKDVEPQAGARMPAEGKQALGGEDTTWGRENTHVFLQQPEQAVLLWKTNVGGRQQKASEGSGPIRAHTNRMPSHDTGSREDGRPSA